MTKSIQIILVLLTFLSFYTCSKNSKKEQKDSNTITKTDSILQLIKESQGSKLNAISKLTLLQNAFLKTNQIANDSIKNNLYTKLSFNLYRTDNDSLFRQINTTAISLSEKLKDSINLPSLHWDLALFFKQKNKIDSAFYHLIQAEKIYSKTGKTLFSGQVLLEKASFQNTIGDYTGSEITSIAAIKKFNAINNSLQISNVYSNLADVAKLSGNYSQAFSYYNNALEYLNKTKGNTQRILSHANNVALVHQKIGNHDQAIKNLTTIINSDSLLIKRPILYARALNNLGLSYLETNQYDQLPYLFEQALIQNKINRDIPAQASCLLNLGKYYLSQKDTTNALVFLKKATKNSSNQKKFLEVLLEFSKADVKNANKYTQKYATLNDSLQNEERKMRNKFARIQFETDAFKAENKHLIYRNQLWANGTLIFFLLVFLASIIYYQNVKNQKLKFQQAQQASNQEIFNLMLAQNQKLEEGKKLEQKRISEELHDGVQSSLQGARMLLIGLNKRKDQEAIDLRKTAINTLQEIQEDVRAISHELSHSSYRKMNNFISTLQKLIDDINTESTINVSLSYSKVIHWDSFSGDIKINLYRIIQECLQNAIKHAECTILNVDFKLYKMSVIVTISDNGKGFVLKKGKRGIGMRNIASRVDKINGSWEIKSVLKKGSTVQIKVPL